MLEKLKNLDNELKQHIEELYPKLKNLIEFIDIYNKNCTGLLHLT